MTLHGIPISKWVAALFAAALFAAFMAIAVRAVNTRSDRCNPAGGCVDAIDSPHVLRRLQ